MKRSSAFAICCLPLLLAVSGCQTVRETELEEPALIAIGGPDRYKSMSTPASFSEFKSKTRRGDFDAEIDQERYGLLREAAVSYAAQAGYQRRVWQVMRELERDSAKLSQSFDFNRVAYRAPRETGYLLPPVVSRATAAINVAETGQSAIAADEYYRIEIPGRLVSVVPTWRDYLIIPLEEATEPGDDFLPQNREERKVFDRFAEAGWRAGVEQADEALELNFARLKRDYLGMVEYRKMVQAGLVQEMVVQSSEQRSAGEGDELFIGERRVKIVSAARLVRNPNHWKSLERRYSVAK